MYSQNLPQEESLLHLPARCKVLATATGSSRYADQHGLFRTAENRAMSAADLPMTARSVPEMTNQSMMLTDADVDIYNGVSLEPPTSHTYHHHQHYGNLYDDPPPGHKNLFDQVYKAQETDRNHDQEFVSTYDNVAQPTFRASLNDFEDVLRHRINVHIEDFRLGLQHTLTGEFTVFRSPPTYAELPAKCGRYDDDSRGSMGGQTAMTEHASADSRDMDSVRCTIDQNRPACNIEKDCNSGEFHSDKDHESGVCSASKDCEEPHANIDQLIDQQLIQLQTCADLITSTLRRPEYVQFQ